MFLKVMTFNIQHCKNYRTGKIDFDIFADAIKSVNADIIGLNEVRGKGENSDFEAQAKILAEMTGLNYFFAPAINVKNGGPYGNAILSKYPVKKAEIIIIPDPAEKKYNDSYETRCVLKAVIDVGCDVTVLVTHFGLNPDEEENASETVLKNVTDEKCVLMGDFNILPDSVYLNPIRERMTDTADDFDYILYSFPSDRPDRKIDYIFTSKEIQTISAEIPAMVVSDHRPYIAVLEI